jgi:uncharacterized heparinase superfamily protein
VRFITKHSIQNERIDVFLYKTYKILLKNLEYHLLGNHLLENAFSLLFGSYYFKKEDFYKIASKLLRAELNKQVLSDGAHFELSPMYHQIILYRILDCINLLLCNEWIKDDLLNLLYKKASIMFSWLKKMTFPSGNIPLLNDSAENVAPSLSKLWDYAERLHIADVDIPLSDSNYRLFKQKKYTCIIDVGGIAPVYQPGHAHADTFNFVIEAEGKPFLVDTGCSTYERGNLRMSERGTSAHNTVTVDRHNSSQVWASHRVGKRARVSLIKDTVHEISARHDGYGEKIHTRTFIQHDRFIEIIDEISGVASENIAFFHLDNKIKLLISNDNEIIVPEINAKIIFDECLNIYINAYKQAVGFNNRLDAKCICVNFLGILKTKIIL